MSTPDLAPRGTLGGLIAVWVASALMGIAIGLLAPEQWRAAWLALALAGCLVLSFAVQLWHGHSQRFLQRVAASVLGSLLILGLISAGFGLAAIVPV
ncbi:MAG: hypothetical protein J0I44_05695 [Microbacterium sp.]|uniref:hypothetical protein n=1 Tax=Microbacterium sp. TaxID=51671 RepID=UPI00092B58F6|nr:hypothetical protein [Microbacterium sp.]OJU68725.1 MAG: hypothetical protein BGO04_00065 [Microbacterium sp. 70-38]MBN9180949.1 hypothetical protein [Microbacterium sp.]MBN9186840.1 hypothetical protein [Microbacterium sp.]MBN9189133.1 hypothetical protein [Microbacterium sp.]MBN9194121.1 hypothetical protein [Microbacterium sp.]